MEIMMLPCSFKRIMEQTDQITLFIEPIDVGRWKLFQQFYEPFTTIVDSGVFAIKNGHAVLHFDKLGVLQRIERGDVLYSKMHLST